MPAGCLESCQKEFFAKHSNLIRSILLLVGLLSGTCSLLADSSNASAAAPWKLPQHEWFLKRLPPPPAANSPEAAEDLAEVIKLQANATPEQIARAEWTYNLSVFTFGEALDKNFTASRFPQTARFFRQLNDLVEGENDFLKNYYRRPHPFEVDPAHVRRIVIAPPGYTYPGFHSSRCVVFGNVLAILDPAGTPTFQLIAKQVEIDRILAGEHFPSDIRGGKELGALIFGELIKDKNFLADVQHLKAAEWTPPPPPTKNIQIAIP